MNIIFMATVSKGHEVIINFSKDVINFFSMEKARKFVKAITRNTRSDLAPIRVKEIYRFEDMQQILSK